MPSPKKKREQARQDRQLNVIIRPLRLKAAIEQLSCGVQSDSVQKHLPTKNHRKNLIYKNFKRIDEILCGEVENSKRIKSEARTVFKIMLNETENVSDEMKSKILANANICK
jgi:hypothetical protein